MADFVLKGQEWHNAPAIDLPKVGGGDARFWDMSDKHSWMGLGLELVKTVPTITTLLKDTDFATWTPSTTAADILASQNIDTYVTDMANYEYVLEWLWDIQAAYEAGATLKNQFKRSFGAYAYALVRRSSTLANIATNTGAAQLAASNYGSVYYIDYYNANGVETLGGATGYGFYISAVAPSFSSSSAAKPTLTLKTPTFRARCSSTYMSTARAAELDQNNTTIKLTGKLFRVNKETNFVRGLFKDAGDIFNSPL